MAILGESSVALAADRGPQLANLNVGVGGVVQVGRMVPVSCEVRGGTQGETFRLIVRTLDADGNRVLHELAHVTISDGEPVSVEGVCRIGRMPSPVQIELRNADDRVVHTASVRTDRNSTTQAVRLDTMIWLLAGEHPQFQVARERWNEAASSLIEIVQTETLDAGSTASNGVFTGLPSSAEGLESVDLLALHPEVPVSDEQSEVLRRWVERGGKLVLSIGEHADSFQTSPLASWLPILPQRQIELKNLSGLNAAVAGSSQLRLVTQLPAAELDPDAGVILADGLAGPVLMRAAFGRGQVTMLSIRMDRRPLSTWDLESQADFALLLANLDAPWSAAGQNQTSKKKQSTELTASGVSDLSTQMLNSLDNFVLVGRTSHWQVLGWIVLFALAVGPVDYLLLKHLLKRPRWTWLTMPIWIAVFATFAVSTGNSMNRVELQSRQVDLVDFDTSNGQAQCHSWYGFYSPATRRYEVTAAIDGQLPVEAKPALQRISWTGRPEPRFRGMYREGEIDPGRPEYRISADRGKLENLPVNIWSSATVEHDWELTDVPAEEVVESKFEDIGGTRMRGEFTYHLPGELHQWVLAYGSFAYFPRTNRGEPFPPLKPGDRIQVGKLRSNILKGVLNGTTLSAVYTDPTNGFREGPLDAYDPLSVDPFLISRMISFYQATGGHRTLQIGNHGLRKLDLSPLLKLRRAVLFGRYSTSVTGYRVDGEEVLVDESDTFVRVLLPVEKVERNNDAAPSPELLTVP